MKVLHEFYLRYNTRTVRLTKTHLLISYSGDGFRIGARFSVTRKNVKRALTSPSEDSRLPYRDEGVNCRAAVDSFKIGFNLGCQHFRGAQARLVRKWAGVK
jgi:hypothetical protein